MSALAVATTLAAGAMVASGPTAVVTLAAAAADAGSAPVRAAPALAAPGHLRVTFARVVRGLSAPVLVTSAQGTSRLFVVEQRGIVRAVSGTKVSTYLDIRRFVRSGGEQGMLGLAFAPDFARSHLLWVTYTRPDGALVLARFHPVSATSSSARPASRHTILVVPHPTYTNHNGGSIAFGRDGYLYLGTGDGGGHGDPRGNAQNRRVLSGKMLRLNVRCALHAYCSPATNPYATSTTYRHEIWMTGLRNPWRWSFDTDGTQWIGDVGQDRYEEIDAVPAARARAANLGWSCREGLHIFAASRCNLRQSYWRPSIELCHPDSVSGCAAARSGEAIIGGAVYRGRAYPSAVGAYVFADYVTGKVWVFNGGVVAAPASVSSISGFGMSRARELFAVTLTGGLYRVGFRTV